MKISLVAFSASATASAMLSELARYVLPSPSKPSGGITGTIPWFSSVCRSSVSTRSTLPVSKWSMPWMIPSGWATMAFVLAARRSLAERPSQDLVCETVRGVYGQLQRGSVGHAGAVEVGRLDTLLFGESLICSAAPCTSTTRMFNDRRTATSRRMLAKLSSVKMTPPPQE